MTGSFRLNSLTFLAASEGPLADSREGALEWVVDDPSRGDYDAKYRERLPDMLKGAYDTAHAPFSRVMGNRYIIKAYERYIFCCSRKLRNRHLINRGLSVIYEIMDTVAFAHLLKESCDGKLTGIRIGKANYDCRNRRNFGAQPYCNDEFEKDFSFFSEQETRISFTPREDVTAEFLIVSSPAASALMRKVEW